MELIKSIRKMLFPTKLEKAIKKADILHKKFNRQFFVYYNTDTKDYEFIDNSKRKQLGISYLDLLKFAAYKTKPGKI